MNPTHRILAVGYAEPGFGYGRVLHSLLSTLGARYDVHQLELSSAEGATWPWTVHRNQIQGDRFGLQQLPSLVERLCPRVVFVVGEIWTVGYYTRLFRDHDPAVKLIAYCPIDGRLQRCAYLSQLSGLSRLVVCTEYGRRVVMEASAQLKQEGIPAPCPPIEVIPHGVDTAIFYPYAWEGDAHQRRYAKEELWPELADSFIVLNANRNQPRKRVDLTIRGFSLFAQNKPSNVRLYLHMGINDEGPNILGLAKTYGILDRVLLTGRSRDHPCVSDAALNQIYNACDVGLNTSGGEGWGLCSFEHAATGAAQVVPKHSACEELWTDSALLVDTVRRLPNDYSLLELLEVSVEGVAGALERYYQDRELLRQMARAAWRNATQPKYQWENIAARFTRMFEDIVS